MKIVISPRAEKALKSFSKIDQFAIARKIRLLIENQISREEKLRGFLNIFRVRVGDYRIIFKKNLQQIYIILINHKKEVYNLLKRLF